MRHDTDWKLFSSTNQDENAIPQSNSGVTLLKANLVRHVLGVPGLYKPCRNCLC